jgi:AraC-like DNA-binding protein
MFMLDAQTVAHLRYIIKSQLAAIIVDSESKRCLRLRRSILILEKILRDTPSVRVTLDDVAEILCVERTYCCRVFREVTGLCFTEWDRRRRIGIAMIMLHSSDASITSIASSCGYIDLTTFERNFRKFVGVSPTHYRLSTGESTGTQERKLVGR